MKAILKGVISQKYGLNQEKIDYQGIQQQLQEQEIELSQQELQQYVQRADILVQSLIQKSEDNAEEKLQKIIQEQGFDEERDIRDIIDVWLKNQEKIYSALMKKNTTSKILEKLEYSINNVSYSKKSKGLQEITSVVSLKVKDNGNNQNNNIVFELNKEELDNFVQELDQIEFQINSLFQGNQFQE